MLVPGDSQLVFFSRRREEFVDSQRLGGCEEFFDRKVAFLFGADDFDVLAQRLGKLGRDAASFSDEHAGVGGRYEDDEFRGFEGFFKLDCFEGKAFFEFVQQGGDADVELGNLSRVELGLAGLAERASGRTNFADRRLHFKQR